MDIHKITLDSYMNHVWHSIYGDVNIKLEPYLKNS